LRFLVRAHALRFFIYDETLYSHENHKNKYPPKNPEQSLKEKRGTPAQNMLKTGPKVSLSGKENLFVATY
jgi:hypothetical protein